MIPEAAVEAAAEASYNATHRTQWWQLSTGYKRELLPPARAALEAAAPHMRAGGDRSELAQLIRDESNTYDGRYVMDPDHLADEIMLDGWTK